MQTKCQTEADRMIKMIKPRFYVTAQLKWIKRRQVYTEGGYVLLSEVIIYKLRSGVREELKEMETGI